MRRGLYFTFFGAVILTIGLIAGLTRGDTPSYTIVHYTPATKEQAKAANEQYRKQADEIASKMHLHFETLETDHFLVFTDWDPREFHFLKENVEGAYTAVCRQFDASPNENVFIGKLPIYMFAEQLDFEKFGEKFDEMKRNKLILGYYRSDTSGIGHMAMWKPDVAAADGDVHLAERQWAYVLTHEFTHAFVARYRTNVFLPRWLSEGVAEVVAFRQFPRANIYDFAHRMAANGYEIDKLFEHKDLAKFGPEDYPIAQTVVEAMLHDNPKVFLKYFNDIKDGMDPDDALEKEYHTNETGLQRAWKKYALTLRG
jgi:hypothetical protein